MTQSVLRKTKQRLTKKLDSKFSKLVRARDSKCVRCGSTKNLQCSHIITRKNKHYRWNFKNAKTLCLRCHLYWWHKEPVDAMLWLQNTLPEMYNWALEHRYVDNVFFRDKLSILEEINNELDTVTLSEIKEAFENNNNYNYII